MTNQIKLLDDNFQLNLDVSKQLAQYELMVKAVEEKRAEIVEAIKQAMEQNNIDSFDNQYVHITYRKETVRASLDLAKLKEEEFDLYSKYLKESKVKSSVTIKTKGVE